MEPAYAGIDWPQDSILAGSGWRFALVGVVISRIVPLSNQPLPSQTQMYSCYNLLAAMNSHASTLPGLGAS